MSRQLTNDQIKSRVQNIYRTFVTNVDPDDLCDHLIQNRIITIEFRDTIKTKDTKQQQCRELLSHLYSISNQRTFLVVLEALKTTCEHIYEEIQKQTDTETGGADELSAVHNDDLEQSSSSFQDRMTKLEEERDELRDRVQALEAQLQSGKRKRMADETNAITKKQGTDTVDFNQSDMATGRNDFDVKWAHELVQWFKKAKAESKDGNWWKDILVFEWSKIRAQKSTSTQWVSIKFNSKEGMKPLIIGMQDELNVGTIAPSTDEAASKKKVEKRTTKPTVQIQKWAFLLDNETPDEKYKSGYYDFMSILSEAFEGEVKQLQEAGKKFVANHDKIDIKSIKPGEMILPLSDMKDLKKKLPLFAVKELQDRVIFAPNINIVPLTQRDTKDGVKMTNPLTRISVNFVTTFKRKPTQLYTKVAEGKCVPAIVDGEEVNDDNIHKFIRSQCSVTGAIQMDSVCFSDKGISIPIHAHHLIVETPKIETPEIDISNLGYSTL